jgi:hypothetical protein
MMRHHLTRHRPPAGCALLLAALGTLGAVARPAAAQTDPAPAAADRGVPYPTRCGVGIPAEEARGYTPLPRGSVFCPLIADPKGLRSYVSYQRGDVEEFATNIGSVGIADEFGLVRFGGRNPGDGVQLSLTGGVFAQFDLDAQSYDLLNADYVIGLPITMRRGGLSGRLRVYHQSSHLGDEFILRDNAPERENLSFESAELLVSQDLGPLRVYAGGEYFFNRDPVELPRGLVHAGAELRPAGNISFGTAGRVRPLAAVDVKAVDEARPRVGVSARAGLEVGRAREGVAPSRRWSLLYEFYNGPSPYGQFHQNDVRLSGIGFHFSL